MTYCALVLGHKKNINFPFVPNENVMVFRCPNIKHIRMFSFFIFTGRNQSLSCGQSGIEQNIPYTSGLWQCRPPHPDLVDVPPYKAQPFMSGCHGNNFSGHSYCCDIPQNIQQASIISGR